MDTFFLLAPSAPLVFPMVCHSLCGKRRLIDFHPAFMCELRRPARDPMQMADRLEKAPTSMASPTCKSDRLLLSDFVLHGDEDAFGVLVDRHWSMVLVACRQILGNRQDAEDAAQTAFAALAKNAKKLGSYRSVANWLWGIARRTAISIRRKRQLRLQKEKHCEAGHRASKHSPEPDKLSQAVNEAVDSLPTRYRLPIILHDL